MNAQEDVPPAGKGRPTMPVLRRGLLRLSCRFQGHEPVVRWPYVHCTRCHAVWGGHPPVQRERHQRVQVHGLAPTPVCVGCWDIEGGDYLDWELAVELVHPGPVTMSDVRPTR